MRSQARRAPAAAALLALTLLALSCNGSDSVTNPSPAMPAASVNIAGTWTGSFRADAKGCSGSTLTATFEQNGSEVRGPVDAEQCGIRGLFIGTLSGNTLSGKVEMSGCKGGAVLGTASASEVKMSIGDFLSPAGFGDEVLMQGGEVTLRK